MKYIIKSQRDGWYFSNFQNHSGTAEFGRIQDAKVYSSKTDAIKDLRKMGQYGKRVIAITKIGRNLSAQERSQTESAY